MSAGCKVVAAMLFAAIFAATSAAQAQADYPNRPVTLIVPYGAGGVADVGMRILGEQLGNRLKQQFVIENRPGAAGIVAAQTGAAAAPDGYTLLMTGNNTAIAAALFKSLPYNILTDFDSVSTAAFFDLLIVTRAGSPLKSVADLIAAAKANPGKLNIGTINPGSTQNLAAELFTSTAGIKAAIVPFRTSPDMAGAVMRGDVDVAFEFYAALSGLLADNKIVALASTGVKAHGLSARRADRDGKRHQGLRRRQLERAVGSRRHAEAGHRHAQRRHERGHSRARRAEQSEPDGHGHALE